MVEAAMTHIRYDTSITRAYHRIAERRGRQVAIVAAARRLLLCSYWVLKDKRPYRPFHGQAFKTSRERAVPQRDVYAIGEAWMQSHSALVGAYRRMPFIEEEFKPWR